MQARSQDLEKGGLFWKSEKSANDLDPNSHCSWISFTRFVRKLRQISRKGRKFKGFFRPKSGGLQKKSLHRNWDWFFGRNQVVSKKKGLHRSWDWFFGQIRKFKRFRGGCFPIGGLFSIFHTKSASKAPKTCDFAYFTSQWGGGGSSPPPGYATVHVYCCTQRCYKKLNT